MLGTEVFPRSRPSSESLLRLSALRCRIGILSNGIVRSPSTQSSGVNNRRDQLVFERRTVGPHPSVPLELPVTRTIRRAIRVSDAPDAATWTFS